MLRSSIDERPSFGQAQCAEEWYDPSAGTTAIGDVQQASAEGYLNIRFHTLRMPDGREEKIEGVGVALDHRPLKGEVSGKNTGKKILSRTLSGVGTIAAYVVGAGGAGLNTTITGE